MEGESRCYLAGGDRRIRALEKLMGQEDGTQNLMGQEDHPSFCVEGNHWNWSCKSHIRKTELFFHVHAEEIMPMRCFVAHLCPPLWHEHGHHHPSLSPAMQVRSAAAAAAAAAAAYAAPIAAAAAAAA